VHKPSRAKSATRFVDGFLSFAAIVIALVNNDTYQRAIGVPVVLAVVGVGLWIEAVLSTRSG
jgi:hypothetical protein